MAIDIAEALTQLRRDIAADTERIIDDRFTSFRNDMQSHVDAIYYKLERLETEYQAIKAALVRLEERMDRVEKRFDGVENRLASIEEAIKLEIRQEIGEIKDRIAKLQERVAELEAQL